MKSQDLRYWRQNKLIVQACTLDHDDREWPSEKLFEHFHIFFLGEPEWVGPADGADQGDVCEEAGDDEEDEQRHRPRPGSAGGLDIISSGLPLSLAIISLSYEQEEMFLLISTLNGKTKELLPSAGILSHVNLLNTDHYMFHSINRDNYYNFDSFPQDKIFQVFLPDPGVSGVRSMGPGVCNSHCGYHSYKEAAAAAPPPLSSKGQLFFDNIPWQKNNHRIQRYQDTPTYIS